MLCIVQARMSSKRFPGKTLKKIYSKPLIYYLLRSLKKTKSIKKIVIATSKNSSDKKIAEYCRENNIRLFRGSLNNVASRYVNILKTFKTKCFIRISADSPLFDHKILNRGINLYKRYNPDIVTNIYPRTYPKGQSVEIINAKTFVLNYKNFNLKNHFEHVTPYFYKNSKKFNIINFKNKKNLSKINLSVDTKKDFDLVTKILKKVKDNNLKNILKKLNEK